MARIVLHTLGSSGDLNPVFALAYELDARGHDVRFALSPAYADCAREWGFDAWNVGPDFDAASDFFRRLLKPSSNGINLVNILFREALIPGIEAAADELTPLVEGADLFVSHTIQLAARVVAHRTGVPWASISAACMVYPTAEYPPPGTVWPRSPRWAGALAWRIARRVFHPLDKLANAEYTRLGVPPVRDVLLGGSYSRLLTLGLWSPAYFPRPRDWPDWMQVGGYARWDAPRLPNGGKSIGVVEQTVHNDVSSQTIVFTLGSSVVYDPRGFYEAAIGAVANTSWRAILLGAPDDLRVPENLRHRIAKVRYARYSDIFPGVNAVVHSGGVGTTQAACYYGVPSLVIPRAADQFENAAHVQREGCGLRLLTHRVTANGLRVRLQRLFASPAIARRAVALGARMRSEPGVAASADILECLLDREKSRYFGKLDIGQAVRYN